MGYTVRQWVMRGTKQIHIRGKKNLRPYKAHMRNVLSSKVGSNPGQTGSNVR